jgi:hypothetical protein
VGAGGNTWNIRDNGALAFFLIILKITRTVINGWRQLPIYIGREEDA